MMSMTGHGTAYIRPWSTLSDALGLACSFGELRTTQDGRDETRRTPPTHFPTLAPCANLNRPPDSFINLVEELEPMAFARCYAPDPSPRPRVQQYLSVSQLDPRLESASTSISTDDRPLALLPR
ncbi:unnamed protein product [Rhizoctonia solani]|uniref:Uncharacterized protein n=1 Tax=Rhizoctonia solani TaxID=456999 RepID=A0A8H3BYT4_9AGAM|nr:unnamed protein product [Rhizoctonia solani]